MDFYDLLGFWGEGGNKGKGGAMLTPNELVVTLGGCYLGATFGENLSTNVTVRVRTDRHTHTL